MPASPSDEALAHFIQVFCPSASTTRTRFPFSWKAAPRCIAIVLFPTPPFCCVTAMISAAKLHLPVLDAAEFYLDVFLFQCVLSPHRDKLAIWPRFMRINAAWLREGRR